MEASARRERDVSAWPSSAGAPLQTRKRDARGPNGDRPSVGKHDRLLGTCRVRRRRCRRAWSEGEEGGAGAPGISRPGLTGFLLILYRSGTAGSSTGSGSSGSAELGEFEPIMGLEGGPLPPPQASRPPLPSSASPPRPRPRLRPRLGNDGRGGTRQPPHGRAAWKRAVRRRSRRPALRRAPPWRGADTWRRGASEQWPTVQTKRPCPATRGDPVRRDRGRGAPRGRSGAWRRGGVAVPSLGHRIDAWRRGPGSRGPG